MVNERLRLAPQPTREDRERVGLPVAAEVAEVAGAADAADVADVADVAEVAAAIAATLTVTSARWPSVPAEHSTERTGIRVLSNANFDVWLLRWPAGTSVAPHDHGRSAGGFAVVAGALEEVRWNSGVRTSQVVRPGRSITVEQGVVHDVVGVTDGTLSVHVYAPPLREMTYYDETGRRPVRRELVEAGTMEPQQPVVAAARPGHPSDRPAA